MSGSGLGLLALAAVLVLAFCASWLLLRRLLDIRSRLAELDRAMRDSERQVLQSTTTSGKGEPSNHE